MTDGLCPRALMLDPVSTNGGEYVHSSAPIPRVTDWIVFKFLLFFEVKMRSAAAEKNQKVHVVPSNWP